MFKFPSPPHVFAVKQLECISCKHILPVAEADLKHAKRQSSNWRDYRKMPPAPGPGPVVPLPPSETHPLYCPRCGVDNRNWLYLSQSPIKELWSQLKKYSFFIAVILLVLFLGAVIGYQQYQNYYSINPGRIIVQLIILFLAIVLPFAFITNQWRDLRDYKYLRQVAKFPAVGFLSPPVRTSLVLGVILVFLIPVTYYLVIPAVQKAGKNIVAAEPELNQVERIDKLTVDIPLMLADGSQEKAAVLNILSDLKQATYEQASVCSDVELAQMSDNLRAILSGSAQMGNAALLASAIDQLDTMQEMDVSECRADLLGGVALLLGTYLSSETSAPPAGDGKCENKNIAQEALSGRTLVNLDPDCYKEIINQMIVQLEDRQADFSSPDLAQAGSLELTMWATDVLRSVREIAVKQPDSPLPERMETDLASLEKRLYPPQKDEDLEETVSFVFTWIRFVGVTAVVSSIVAIWFTYQTEKEYDPHLPRPIFNSVSRMTQTTKWEINRTLEPQNLAQKIQWMRVERNRSGGINLAGLFRDPPDLVEGNPADQVRAQQYTVETDPWCYIRKTDIQDVMVPRPAGGPAFAVSEEEIEEIIEVPQEQRQLPPPNDPQIYISRRD